MTTALLRIAVLAALVLPGPAMAQSTVEGRLNELQRALSRLSAQLEQLKAQDQQLQQRLEAMQSNIGQRLEHLEKSRAAKPAPRPAAPKR